MPTEVKKDDFFAAILFDMDGTLVDTEPYWLEAETELMANHGYAWTEEDQSKCLGGPLSYVGEYMFSLVESQKSPEFFTESLIDRMAEKLQHGVGLMEGAHELLDLCVQMEIPIALVSASPRVLVDAAISDIKSAKFGISVSFNDVTRVKPDPEGYYIAANHLGVDISRCLILEDSANGVKAAIASGAWVVAIPHLVPISPGERLAVVSSVRELSLAKLNEMYRDWNL